MPGKTRSAEPADTKPLKTYCTLREAFDRVGAKVCGPEWQSREADFDPARAKQQTDARSLLRTLAPDGLSFTEKRLPVPPRPIDGDDGAKLEQAIERHTKALKELLRLLHSGLLPAVLIAEGQTTVREGITASAWPDPAEFDPKNPTWVYLWFNIAADRVVLNLPDTSPVPDRAHSDGSLWWAYGGRAGRVEIDREALERALRPPEDKGTRLSRDDQKKGGSRRTYNKGLQSFINQRSTEFAQTGKPFTLGTFKDWLHENARPEEPYETDIPDCDDLEFQDNILHWKNRRGDARSLRDRSLEPYIQRAKQR